MCINILCVVGIPKKDLKNVFNSIFPFDRNQINALSEFTIINNTFLILF